MNIFIAGIDGYLGWPLAQHLAARGHQIAGADLFLRRHWVEEMGSYSAIPVSSIDDRLDAFRKYYKQDVIFRKGDMLNYEFLRDFLKEFRPDAIVHLAEMPSAAYSMIDQQHASFTQQNNVIGSLNLLWAIKETCPDAHLIKLGTMGEYGTPDIDIPEGFFEVEFRGRKDYLPFPRQAGSFYHWSKVHDSNNTMFACKVWGLKATDIMQGVVFGTYTDGMGNDPRLQTRLDFDQCFGTVVNRFCCEAIIGHPLTLYGAGGQKRGFLPLVDSMQCLTIAIENPPQQREYRIFNQFEDCYAIEELAYMVQKVALNHGIQVDIAHYDNPRKELEHHYFNPDHNHLLELGYQPTQNIEVIIQKMLQDLSGHKVRILHKKNVLIPDIRWDNHHRPSFIVN
ncbi:MAG: NAD-dependent epimerase/dehydratase family protein [Chloroflexota bacterium]